MTFDITAYSNAVAAWWPALKDFKQGNPVPLSDLLRTESVPDVVRDNLADTIAAAPLKHARNADKRKGTSAQRRLIDRQLAWFHRTLDSMDVGDIACELRIEPSEVVALRAKVRRQLLEYLAKETDLAPDTIRKMSRGK